MTLCGVVETMDFENGDFFSWYMGTHGKGESWSAIKMVRSVITVRKASSEKVAELKDEHLSAGREYVEFPATMQFALPPRKPTHSIPHTYLPPSSRQCRRQLKIIATLSTVLIIIFYLSWLILFPGSRRDVAPVGIPNVVIVTTLDREALSDGYMQKIMKNREDYARLHGYVNFFANTSDYLYTLREAPRSWAIVPAVRHAMTVYPHATYFFHLTPHALIMNSKLSLTTHVLDPRRLASVMLKGVPVVPPDSIIKTFAHLKGSEAEFIVSQDKEDLTSESFIIKQGDWAHFFLDAWFDPLYRSYNFVKAEKHALDHIVQWHPTVLAKLALLPQRILNAYSKDSPGASSDGTYHEGDFIIRFSGCESDSSRNCEAEMEPFFASWKRLYLQIAS